MLHLVVATVDQAVDDTECDKSAGLPIWTHVVSQEGEAHGCAESTTTTGHSQINPVHRIADQQVQTNGVENDRQFKQVLEIV